MDNSANCGETAFPLAGIDFFKNAPLNAERQVEGGNLTFRMGSHVFRERQGGR